MPYMVTEQTAEVAARVFSKKYVDINLKIGSEYKEGGKVGEYTPDDARRFISLIASTGLGPFQRKNEGETAAYDQPGMLIPSTAFFQTQALMAGCSFENYEEDPMKFWQKLPGMFAKSARNTKDTLAALLYNLAFVADGGYLDGRPLIDSNHPLYPQNEGGQIKPRFGAFQSNYIGALPPSIDALVQAKIIARTAVDDRGMKDRWTIHTIVTPEALDNIWDEIISKEAVRRPYTGANTINTQAGKWKKEVWRDLTSPYAWFTIGSPGLPGDFGGDCHGLGMWYRWNYKTHVWDDHATLSRLYMAYFRYAAMAWTYKRLIGSSGATGVSA
jgi:hypothetical protein